MGEIKSVKVDNWGVFFLQKLQNFFNKTDFCDLTLQFRDNSQLKVHRLVLSACTDFFNVLEQTCELIDDALVMPIELQADVVVPIVNFMYTGTLEFELKMYNKLLNTAREMNMTVLLKLLEAHKRTMETTKTGPHRSNSPRTKRATASSPQIAKVTSSPHTVSSTQQTQRSLLSVTNPATPVRRRYATVKQMTFRENMQKIAPVVHRGPTRYEALDPNNAAEAYEPSFDSMSYESRPLKEEPEDYDELQPPPVKQRSSPFEQLRKGYNNNKRPAVTTLTSPPAKKPNIEDVKEFSEQQRMRKQIAAEYGDDAEYDGVMDDDIHNDDDDDEPLANSQSVKKQTQHQKEKQLQPQASIIIKQSPNEKPTIVVKDNSNSKMDHAKIISEVLRQYPHLVKSNKNIKLKIMPNVGGQPQKITVRKEDLEQNRAIVAAQQNQMKQTRIATNPKQATLTKVEAQTSASVTSVENVVAAATAVGNVTTNIASLPTPKRRIDSKTMHALIAQGAANTTGPWLCLRCGVNGRPISIPSYRGFRRHLINTHKESIDPALCEHCGWHSSSNRILGHHLLVEHKIPSAQYKFPKCDHCTEICIDEQDLDKHIDKVHPDEHKQQCIYCNKVFIKEMQLYNHMKTYHRKIAREDNVIDFSEDELADFDEEMTPQATTSTVDKKIKIISDISLPSTILKLEEIPGAAVDEDYANDSGPKFVNADGNEMLLTAEQREEIMSQLDQDHDGGVVMVLNESAFPPGGEAVVVGDETKIDSTENADMFSDHHIYSDFPTDAEGEAEFATGHDTSAEESALEVNKEEQEEIEEEVSPDHEESGPEERMDEDHMEWAQNLISAHDADDNEHEDEDEHMDDEEMEEEEATAKKTTAKASSAADDDEDKQVSSSKSPTDRPNDEAKAPKKEDDISLKLKMLTGDWSDDEIEDDEDEAEENETTSSKLETNADLAATLATDDTTDETTIEKPSSEVGEKEKETTIKKEVESTPPAVDDPAVEEEISQSTHSEAAEEAKPKEAILEEDLSEENLTKAKQPESKTSETATKADDKDKETQKSSPTTEDTKPRRTSAIEKAVKLEVKEENISDDPIAEEPIESTTSPKQSGDDHLAELEKDETETQTKADSNSDKQDTVTSTKEDSVKSVDKVKSLISEWADDDDEN